MGPKLASFTSVSERCAAGSGLAKKSLLERQSARLFADPETNASFVTAVQNPKPAHPHILWLKRPAQNPFKTQNEFLKIDFVDRLAPDEKPTRHALHQAGAFYSLEASSAFSANILSTISGKVETILDVCASPGGKGLFAWKMFQPKTIYFNEVISKRLGQLRANLKRCGVFSVAGSEQQVSVLNRDPSRLGETITEPVDLVIADVPCSGQSLLIKGLSNPGCFHPQTIKKNVGRQRRILGSVAKLVKTGGYLAYMTCTYDREENEDIIHWFLKMNPGFTALPHPEYSDYQSHLTNTHCYRLWPQSGLGAGSFTALLQRTIPPPLTPPWLPLRATASAVPREAATSGGEL